MTTSVIKLKPERQWQNTCHLSCPQYNSVEGLLCQSLNEGQVDLEIYLGLSGLQTMTAGRVTPCAPPVGNPRVRRAVDCPPYQLLALGLSSG
jgi:hypothetical protein